MAEPSVLISLFLELLVAVIEVAAEAEAVVVASATEVVAEAAEASVIEVAVAAEEVAPVAPSVVTEVALVAAAVEAMVTVLRSTTLVALCSEQINSDHAWRD